MAGFLFNTIVGLKEGRMFCVFMPGDGKNRYTAGIWLRC